MGQSDYRGELSALSAVNYILMVLTVRASQSQEGHFHTAGRGMERPGHNSAGQLCTLPPTAKAGPLYSNGLRTQAVSIEREPQSLLYKQ